MRSWLPWRSSPDGKNSISGSKTQRNGAASKRSCASATSRFNRNRSDRIRRGSRKPTKAVGAAGARPYRNARRIGRTMERISGKYAIVGVGETKVGKRPEASTHSLHLEAIKACLDDAGVKASDVDGLITNQPLNDAHRSYAVRLGGMTRIRPGYATDLALGGATPIAMIQNAVMAIAAGMATTVVCVHARKRATPDPTPGHAIRHGDENWEEPWGHFSAVANHAFAAQRHMHDFGTTSEDLAHVAVATRKHACLNNNATMRKPMTVADHQASRFICEPLRLFDCALESDGGGAVIVTSAERAHDFPKKPVAILGMRSEE